MAEDVFEIVGTVVAGAYQVEAVVAEGGFGVVYRAFHSGFRAPVALKCLKVPQQLSSEQEEHFLEQFRAEAELLFRLSAGIPTVVRPLHVDAMTLPDGRFVPFMALEWLEGETLEQIAERRKAEGLPPIPLKKLVRMLTPVARALDRAHNFQGPDGQPISIVHRDMKPENIFVANVAGEEVVKILDFGIGKAKSMASQVAGRASQSELTFTSFTPAYGAPEQWVPKRYGQTGPWTDVWGLALTIVEVMAGRTIIDGDQAAMMGTVLDPTRRPTPRHEGLDVPDAVEQVFQVAMAVDPRQRYGDAGTFWTDLQNALGMRTDGRDAYTIAARDARAEGGAVPRTETIEAATRQSGSPSRRGSSAAMQAVALPDAAVPADLFPEREPPSTSRPIPMVPDLHLGEIPDLGVSAGATMPKKSDSPPAYSRELDFDDHVHGASKLELDVGPEERPSVRAPGGSRPDWPAVTGSRPDWPVPQEAEPRRRVPSGATPAVGGRRPNSGEFAVAPDGPQSNPVSSPEWSPPTVPPASAHGGVVRPRGSLRPGLGASSPNWPLPPLGQPVAESSIVRRLAPGAALILLSILATVGDQLYAGSSGEVFMLGPIRGTWIAGIFMLAGVVLIALRLIPRERS